MLFNSIDFLIFFPVVVLVYFVVPRKFRCIWLLVASYYFYMSWNPKYALLIAASTVITYLSGLMIERHLNNASVKKACLWGSLLSNLGILALFKYANFFLYNIGKVFSFLGICTISRRLDLLLPVGISFYTFQALSYTLDVYYGTIKAEKSLIKYALFVSFFPQLVAGPIERSSNLLCQIQKADKINVWNFERVKNGLLLMLWGLFQKLVIADRAAILVNNVIHSYQDYGFLELSTAVFLFAFQIYCDFGGYTCVARGAARVLGFELMNNFRQPYLATSIKDFWRRWHISLTSWFTQYLYIPLGGNRKGTIRKYLNILVVFGVSGLWHGASWNFIAWGLIHAVFQIIGDIKQRAEVKYVCPSGQSFSTRIRKIAVTFLLVDFAWTFFVCDSMTHALAVLHQMCTVFRTCSVFSLGLNRGNWLVLLFSIVLLVLVDILHERNVSVLVFVNGQEIWFRYLVYLGLLWFVVLFGIYGIAYDTSTFIYFQF